MGSKKQKKKAKSMELNKPDKLYKYCGGDFMVENIGKDQFYFGAFGELNDPYEGMFKFEIQNNCKQAVYEHYFKKEIDIEKYDYSVFEIEIIKNQLDIARKLLGVASFTEEVDSLTMWGHYSDKQRGVCLEFDSAGDMFIEVYKVKYSKNVCTFTFNSHSEITEDNIKKKMMRTFGHKSNKWKYEKEWRIIQGAGLKYKYDKKYLTGIYFGYYTPREKIIEIFNATSDRKDLKYYRPGIVTNEFKLKFEEITYEEYLKLKE